MTYNIRHGVGMDRVLDLERVARVIASVDPDILVLNEVDERTQRSMGVAQTDSLAKLLNLQGRFCRSIDYDGGFYGNALLSRYPILDLQIIDLSTDNLLEGRSVFIATLLAEPDTLKILGTHLGLDRTEQIQQINNILSILPETRNLILSGDFNLESNSEGYSHLTERLRDSYLEFSNSPANTFPADDPQRRIDYIFIGSMIEPEHINPVKSTVVNVASDHLPQVLTFKVN